MGYKGRDIKNVADTSKEEGRIEGRMEGKNEEKIAIAKICIKKGMDDSTISKITRLSVEVIEKLRKELEN